MVPGLENLLKESGKKILFAGIGNVLKSDDGTGVYIVNNLIKTQHIIPLPVEVSLENYIGKINSLNPDILVIVDCASLNSPPGTCRLLTPGEITDFTFNTHNISLKRISEFFSMPVFVLAIQPQNVGFGENLSYIVMHVADNIIKMINKQEV